MQIIANLHIDMKFILLGIFFVGHRKKYRTFASVNKSKYLGS